MLRRRRERLDARYRARGRIPCVEGTAGAEVVPVARPVDGGEVAVKRTFDPFVSTNLERRLRSDGVEVAHAAVLARYPQPV